MIKRYFTYFAASSLLLFLLVYLLIICFYNQKICDDIIASKIVDEIGKINYIKYIYNNWEGSYSQAITSSIISSHWNNISLISYSILLFSITIASLYQFLKKFLHINLTEIQIFLLSFIFFLSLFFADSNVTNDGIVWFTGSYSYLLSFDILLIGIVLVYSEIKIKQILGYCLILYFAGFRLNYTVYVAALLLVYLLFKIFYLKQKSNLKIEIRLTLILILGLVIYLIAPGNGIRAVATKSSLNLSELLAKLLSFKFLINYKTSLFYLLKVHIIKSSLIQLIILTTFFIFKPNLKIEKIKLRNWILVCSSILLVTLLIHTLLMVLIINSSGPDRSYVFIYFIKTGILFLVLTYFFQKINSVNIQFILSSIIILFTLFYFQKRFIPDFNAMKKMSVARIERNRQINESLVHRTDTIRIKLYPKCSFIRLEDVCFDYDPRLENKVLIISDK